MLGTREERMSELLARFKHWKPRTTWQRFLEYADEFSSADFIRLSNGQSMTYGDAKAESGRIADALWNVGVRRGDCVALRMGNSLELVCTMLAIAKIGAIKAGMNAHAGAYEAAFVIKESNAGVLISDRAVVFDEACKPRCLRLQVALSVSQGQASSLDVTTWNDFISAGMRHSSHAQEASDPEGVCDILFTSGSTGNPKGALLCHDQLLRSAFSNCLNRGFEIGRTILVLVPLNHCFGYVEGFLSVLFVGGTLVLPTEHIDPQLIARLIEEHQVNDMLSVPHTLQKLLEYLHEVSTEYDFSSLHALYCAGEKCPEWLWGQIMKTLDIDDVVDGYGMTEVCGAAMQTVPGDGPDVLSSRVGRILPAGSAGVEELGNALVEYKAIDPQSGRECSIGEVGRLFCRGITVMKGYCNSEKQPIDNEGWLDTGDMGSFDSQGYLSLFGRAKDVYRINGENVSPQFIEGILECCPVVKRAVVVGVPDRALGAVGCLFVEYRDESDECMRELESFCQRNLTKFQIPKFVIEMGEEWPLTASGKPRRAVLGQRARKRTALPPEEGNYSLFNLS